MNCNELKRKIKFGQPQRSSTLLSMRQHAASCEACGKLFAAETLTEALVKINAAPATEDAEEFEPSPFWTSRLKHRIQEMREQHAHSWESHLMGLRRWVTALGAVAMLLLAMSAEWRPPATVDLASQPETDLPETALEEATLHVDELISSGPEPGHKPSNLYE
ncbi:MAG: hypothetical protein ACREEM_21550 [Blastocatellia bacterium]